MTSTSLRKHIAVVSQVLALKDVLANFMGDDIRVHREFYRLPEDTQSEQCIRKLLTKVLCEFL